MVVALTMAGALGVGYVLVSRLWRSGELSPLERAAFTVVAGVATWLGSAWLMALTHTLRRPVVIGRTALLVAIAATLLPAVVRALRKRAGLQIPREGGLLLFALLPVLAWLGFVIWRDVIVPPLNHDALAYHLPKAVLFARAHGYRSFADLSWIIAPRASNYELLMADVIVGDASDTFTEWPAALFYVGVVLGSLAIVARWFRSSAVALVTTALLMAGVPVLLLQTGAHKNDLLVALFSIGAMLAASRWYGEKDPRALLLSVAVFAAAVGTKTHSAVLAIALLPLLLMPLLRPFRPKLMAAVALVGLAGVLLLGGYDQVAKLLAAGPAAPPSEAVGVPRYGDWQNLWQAPYILLAAPFSPTPDALRVPWDAEPWFWRRYELFFSDLGIPFALAALAMPFTIAAFRRRDGAARERVVVTIAAFAAFVMLLPVHWVPAGLYLVYMPRFVLFLLPVVFGWATPVIDVVRGHRNGFGLACVTAASLVFAMQAIDAAEHDAFVPLDYVAWARAHPGTRSVAFDPNRVGCIVDDMAGPHDRIVFDAGIGAWIYPAYGRDLTRTVEFIPPGTGQPVIPDADWIVVDRKFSAVWQNPAFTSLGSAQRFMSRTAMQPGDARVMAALLRDPRYRPVLIWAQSKQALFKRVR